MQKFDQFTLIENYIIDFFKEFDTFCVKESSDSKGQLYQRRYLYKHFGKCEIIDKEIPLNYKIEQINSKSKLVTIIYIPLNLPLQDSKDLKKAIKHYEKI